MRLFWGLLLIVVGIIILGTNVGWFDMDLGELIHHYWPVILIVIGVEEIFRHSRKKSWGSVEWTDFDGAEFSRSFGDVHLKPGSIDVSGLKTDQGAGNVMLDLTETQLLNGENRLECKLGMGDLKVVVPSNVPISATCAVGVGDINVLDKHASGFGPKLTYQDPDYANADKKINLIAKVGLGDIRITHR